MLAQNYIENYVKKADELYLRINLGITNGLPAFDKYV